VVIDVPEKKLVALLNQGYSERR